MNEEEGSKNDNNADFKIGKCVVPAAEDAR